MPTGSACLARTRALLGCFLLVILASPLAVAAEGGEALWTDVASRPLAADAPQATVYRALALDVAGMRVRLGQPGPDGSLTLALPKPGGGFASFVLRDSGTMPEDLQRRYPDIVSLSGSGKAGNAVRVDFSSRGFQAMVFGDNGIWVVRPVHLGPGAEYMSFRRVDLPAPTGRSIDKVKLRPGYPEHRPALLPDGSVSPIQTGETEREYRLAVAANHQYVAAVGGGTVSGGLAAVVQAINRVNQIYETELGVHFTLVADNDQIIFADAATDPYSNGGGALDQNQTVLDNVIGNANYDIGHVFTTGSGGVASLGVTCVDNWKARGTTGQSNPTGDAFFVDYVAHEMGHQFGGNHTFNSLLGSCGNGNRNGSTAYEPGSGSTIMAYAGICASDDLQPHSDPYFHAISLYEIDSWIEGSGGSCTVETASGDAAPVIDTGALPSGLSIPVHTPFLLTASASDADGDVLSYNWEQFDLGPSTELPEGDTGSGPIFRSWSATPTAARTFPDMSTVLGGPLLKGEAWPETNRDLHFRLTVRDNHGVPGTPQFGASTSADLVLSVTDQAGPFLLTRPNTNLTWGRGETRLVTWDVAGTDLAPVSCPTVGILLSTDGGSSFAHPLESAVANDGSETVVVPSSLPDSSQARVKITCENNVFFDVSDVNFNIADTGDPDPSGPLASVSPANLALTAEYGQLANGSLSLANGGMPGSMLNFTVNESVDHCASASDVIWLAATPNSGSVVDGNAVGITASADAAGLTLGSHAASLCVATNDATHPLLEVPIAFQVTQPANDQIFRDGFDPPQQALQDPSFEATTGDGDSNPFWEGSDTNGGASATSFFSASYTGVAARTGEWEVWFGGWDSNSSVNTQTASQIVPLANAPALYLTYWRLVTATPEAGDVLSVLVDGNPVASVDASALPVDSAYQPVSVNISSYADGASHEIELRFEHDGSGDDGNIYIDDVTIGSSPATPRP